jgi:1-acyl-sn-glycerol-3-phosphate acyltransferase
MAAKTGAARLALKTGAPVIPIGQWGAHELLPYGTTKPRLFPRKRARLVAGPPVDLSAFEGKPLTATNLRGATAAIMADVTGLLAGLRQETPPAVPFDLAAIGKASAADQAAADQADQKDADPEARPT